MTRRALILQLFALVYLQRLALPLGGLMISLPLIATAAALAGLAAVRRLTFSRTRLVLFAAMGAAAAASQAVAPGPVSLASIAYLMALYAVFTVRLELEAGDLAAVWRAFAALMVLPAVLVVAQYGWQLRTGPGSGLGLDFLFPRRLLLPGYVYQSSSEAWRTWDRPNGVVFLEPSFCSAFLALAFLNEVLWLRRWGLAALFFAALLLCSGATGLVLAAVAVGWRLRRSRSAMLAMAATGLATAALLESRLAGLGRLAELTSPGSSGYDRLVLPLASFYRVVGDPGGWLAGHGAGQISAEFGNAWPLVKLTYEYGLPTAAAWLGLFAAAIAARERVGLRIAVFAGLPVHRRLPPQPGHGALRRPLLHDVRAVTGTCGASAGPPARVCQAPSGGIKLVPGEGGRERAMRPVVLCILDGWGLSPSEAGNAVALGKTPNFDRIWKDCPHATLAAHGPEVGLPEGQMGNSEVGHTNIGAGRVVWMDLPRIDNAIADGSFAKNAGLAEFVAALKESGGTAHLAGLASPGGVHAHQRQIAAAAEVIAAAGVPVAVHAFLDGRDVPPKSALAQIAALEEALPDGAEIRDGHRALLRHGPRQALGAGGPGGGGDPACRGRACGDGRGGDRGRLRAGRDRRVRAADRHRRLSRGGRRGRPLLRQLPRRPGAADPRGAGRPEVRRLPGGRAAEVGGGARDGAVFRDARYADAGDVSLDRHRRTRSGPGSRARG